jgi:hypothetical protein
MSGRGITVTDGFARICLGIFFCCVGLIFLLLFVSFDPNAMESQTISDWAGLAIAMLIPIALLDVGFYQVIEGLAGWRKRSGADRGGDNLNNINPPGVSADGGTVSEEQQKVVQAIFTGISTVNTWAQRLIGIFAVMVAFLVVAVYWYQPILDLVSGKGSFKWGFLLMLGLILGSFVVIIACSLLLKRPRANTYEQ